MGILDVEKIKAEIQKTGFVLENKVCRLLEENGWNIINNRYYLDDVQEVNREIDIIAYKVQKVEDILYYTSLIVSCKKSEKNLWAFLTKDMNHNDPNINFCPIYNWSNDKVLNFMVEPKRIESRVWGMTEEQPHLKFVYGLDKQVFAFQQMNNTSYTPQNDKDIYNSIITTIKALEYERNSLSKRKETKAIYNFNLLSILDGEMITIHFNDEGETIEEIDEIKYLNRHIVNKKEAFYRVHFMKYERLNEYIQQLNELHSWHMNFYPSLIKEFYDNITEFEDNEGFRLLSKEFEIAIMWLLNHKVNGEQTISNIELKYDQTYNKLLIGIGNENTNFREEEAIAEILNNDEYVMEVTKSALTRIYKFDGEFEFTGYTTVTLPF